MITLHVSDIKQYIYCPRIIYFNYVLPIPRRKTKKMEYGHEEHIEIQRLEKRRGSKAYGVIDGAKRFQVYLESSRLGLNGILDMMIITDNEEIFPVEFKNSVNITGLHQKYQLTAYAMLIEENFKKPVRKGFLYLIPSKKVIAMEFTESMREHVKKTLVAMRNIIARERMPNYIRSTKRCTDCEFKNYCADLE